MQKPFWLIVGLGFAISSVAPTDSLAAWIPGGNPIGTGAGAQSGASLSTDGGGGAFVVWHDGRRGVPNTDLYATRILADGSIAPGWPVNGIPLSQAGTVGSIPSLVSDGAGGLMAFWLEKTGSKARMQHVDGSGALWPGFPADGLILPFDVGGPVGRILQAFSDDAGGSCFLWNTTFYSEELRLTRLTGTGAFAEGWNSSGVLLASSDMWSFPARGFSLVSTTRDPAGGLFVGITWYEENPPFGPGTYFGGFHKRRPDGTSVSGGSFPDPSSVRAPFSVAGDGSGGAFVVHAAPAPSPRMQHYLSNGAMAWPNPTAAPVGHSVFGDGAGGFYLLGTSGPWLELHRRAGDGSTPAPWTSFGVVLATTGNFTSLAAQHIGGQVYACWSSGTDSDLRVLAITPNGSRAPGWPTGGASVTELPTGEIMTSLMAMPPENALLAWADLRSGDSDVYVTLLQPEGLVTLDAPAPGAGPSRLAFAPRGASPNPAHGPVRFEFTLPDEDAATFEIVDVAGRTCARFDVEARAGAQSVSFDAMGLSAGLYWARVSQGAGFAVTRFAVAR